MYYVHDAPNQVLITRWSIIVFYLLLFQNRKFDEVKEPDGYDYIWTVVPYL